jgi:KaiC/GvpD/RAD55 family RecA-like ATPase
MALAACMDGTVRMTSDLMGIELDRIRVEVVNRGDVREILRIDDVHISSDTGITMTVELEASGETEERLAKLREAAEAGFAVLQMLRGPIPVVLTWT